MTALSPRTMIYLHAAMAAPRVGEWLFTKEQAPGVIPYALSLLVASMGTMPTGEVVDRRAMAWPPHRQRPTPQRYRRGKGDGSVDQPRVKGLRP